MFKSLLEIKGNYSGKDFVVVGGGPSTQNYNPLFSKDKIVLGCNYRPKHIKFDFHLLHDPLALMWIRKNNTDINNSHIILSHLITKFKEHIKNKKSNPNKFVYALDENCVRDPWVGDIPVKEYLDDLVKRSSKEIYEVSSLCPHSSVRTNLIVGTKWMNSGFFCIDLAEYFGAKKIYLTGFDGGMTHIYNHSPSDRLRVAKNRSYNTHYVYFVHEMDKIKKRIDVCLINSPQSIYNLEKMEF